MFINEDTRNQLVAKSRQGKRERDGKTRYQKRLKSRVASSNKQYNRINMNQLFKNNILTISIEVRGETDNYLVTISYGGFLDELRSELKRYNTEQIELRHIVRALVISFNKDNVYIRCTCPDFRYRFGFWATKNDVIVGEPELRLSDETNPNDDLGSGCKHIMLVLSNTAWIIKVASVVNNYINYMKNRMQKAYADIIYPAIFNKKYEEPVQTTMFDKDELDTDTDTIDQSNAEARRRGQFKPGNEYRFTRKETSDNQMSMDGSIIGDEE